MGYPTHNRALCITVRPKCGPNLTPTNSQEGERELLQKLPCDSPRHVNFFNQNKTPKIVFRFIEGRTRVFYIYNSTLCNLPDN